MPHQWNPKPLFSQKVNLKMVFLVGDQGWNHKAIFVYFQRRKNFQGLLGVANTICGKIFILREFKHMEQVEELRL